MRLCLLEWIAKTKRLPTCKKYSYIGNLSIIYFLKKGLRTFPCFWKCGFPLANGKAWLGFDGPTLMYSVFPKGSKGGYTGTLPLPLPLWGLDLVFLGARLKNGIEGRLSKKVASKNGRSKNPVPNPTPVLPNNPVENCLFCLEPRKWNANLVKILLLSNQIFRLLTPQK